MSDEPRPRGKVAARWYDRALAAEEALAFERELHRLTSKSRDHWKREAERVDRMYAAADAQIAEIRVALEAPNPCNPVAWARRVKERAGPMEDDIVGQVAGLRFSL